MIPLRDTNQSETYPIVNTLIIATNVLVFLVEMSQGERLNDFIYIYGLVPARYSEPQVSEFFNLGRQILSFLTFMFLHGGLLHLLANMWSLYIFGDNIEDRLGHLRYLLFYLLCGLASGLTHLVLNWHSNIPTIGASGAISGVMGAYFVTFPRARILALLPIFFFFYFAEVPAFVFLGIWFLFQFLSAAGSSGQVGGVAWWAHIGGFIFGILFWKGLASLPRSDSGRALRHITRKRNTPRLQLVRPESGHGPDLHGTVTISEHEARYGTRKLLNIGSADERRALFVNIPPGIKKGNILRLRGMGARTSGGHRGDVYLTVDIPREK